MINIDNYIIGIPSWNLLVRSEQVCHKSREHGGTIIIILLWNV